MTPNGTHLPKIDAKIENLEKGIIPPVASILHANPLDSCETDRKSFISGLGAIRRIITHQKNYVNTKSEMYIVPN